MKSEIEILKSKNSALEEESVKLKAKIIELAEENEFFKKEIARVGCAGSKRKEALLLKIVKAHPDCYSQAEFDEAFSEALDSDMGL